MQICIHILSKILQNGSVIEKLWLLQIAIFIFPTTSMPSRSYISLIFFR